MPNIKLTSYGASGQVTGSCHLLNVDGFRILIDCGMLQGSSDNYLKNWDNFLFDPKSIDAVILSHAHLDHCGRLPKLYEYGYRGKVYATHPTIDLAKIVIDDSSNIMEERARAKKLPFLYSSTSIKKLYQNFIATDYHQNTRLTNDISFELNNAGHILGSATISLKIGAKTIVFSGDIGSVNMPLVKDIDYIDKADYVICESTYGNRHHENTTNRNEKLIEAVKKVTLNHSTLLITIFALERTQDILKVLNDYYETHLDFNVPVFLDSPMAAAATKIYKQNLSYLNREAQDTLKRDRDIFDFPHLKITNQQNQSKKINTIHPPKIILAGSGMMEGGRMIHHLSQYISDPKNYILFMGYQVPGTLGHHILNGAFDFDYYGQKIEIKASVEQIDGFSAHADKEGLLNWLSHFSKPKKIILVHGDLKVMTEFSQSIKEKLGHEVLISEVNQSIEL